MIVSLEFTEEQLAQIVDGVAVEFAAKNTHQKPLTVSEFAAATNLSPEYVYRHLAAGTIKRVPNIYKKLIPASELKKYQ